MQNNKEIKINTNTVLGQVFTSKTVAKLMVKLIESYMDKNSTILDPCIGQNIFFNQLCGEYKNLTGIENDTSLINSEIENFYSSPKNNLIKGDFFELDFKEKFDFIIMNPPYVRQESIDLTSNSKNRISKLLNDHYENIPKKSNLYIYFILKALKHLNENGYLVAIIYDSWLYTDFGFKLKEILINQFNLKKIIHFREDAFENINVGATVILVSSKGPQNSLIEYISCQSPKDLPNNMNFTNVKKISKEEFLNFNLMGDNILKYSTDFFVKLGDISNKKVRRGTSAIVNKFFIFTNKRFGKYTKKFVKRITKIKKFNVDFYDYILLLPNEPIKDEIILEYLDSVRFEVEKNPDKYRNLFNKMNKSQFWYSIKDIEGGNVIFNYYMRNNIHFIYNPKNLITSDNFYNLELKENLYENLCILNSTFTAYSLLKFGKSQGGKLFKIQLNKFIKVPIVNVTKLSENNRIKLNELGKNLIKIRRDNAKKIISIIDKILIEEYNKINEEKINLEIINNAINEIKNGDLNE